MSTTTQVICDGCGTVLTEHSGLKTEHPPVEGITIRVGWPSGKDYCERCERKAWLALGRDRGWRATAPRKAPSASKETPPAAEPPTGMRSQDLTVPQASKLIDALKTAVADAQKRASAPAPEAAKGG